MNTNEELQAYALELASALDRAERVGADQDQPEGTRWVRLSDTLAKSIAERLRSLAMAASGDK